MSKDVFTVDAVFERVAALPAATLVPWLAGQAPQAIAALLLRLPPAVAAENLAGLPEDTRHSALRRMAATGPAAPALMERIADTLTAELLTPPPEPARPDALAAILAAMAPDARSAAAAVLGAPLPVPPPAAPPPAPPPEAEPGGDGPPPLRLSPGLAALLNTRVVIRDRMPMLEVVLDRHVRLLSSHLRALCGDAAEVGLARLSSLRFGDWMNGVAPSSATPHPLFAVFHAQGWDHYGLMLADDGALAGFRDAALGGSAEAAANRTAGRAPTGLDRCAMALLADGLLDTLNTAFTPVGTPTFRLDRIEGNPRFATIDRPCNAGLLAELDLRTRCGNGRIALLFPYALLEPVRERLIQGFMGERFGQDPRWAAHLENQLVQARVRVAAVVGTAVVALGAALAWQPGCVVGLDARAGDGLRLVAGDRTVGRGRLGQRGGRLAVTLRGADSTNGTGNGTDHRTEPHTLAQAVAQPLAQPHVQATAGPAGLSAFHSVTLRLSAVVGGAELTVEELLQLGRGGIVELDRRVGEPIDVTVNGRIVARGELVLVEDRLAVSLSEIVGATG